MTEGSALVLFRDDLRIADNGALYAAADTGKPVVAAFVLDEQSKAARPAGSASRWWKHLSLVELRKSLDAMGVPLVLRRGRTAEVVNELIEEAGADTVLWNRRYEPAGVAIDTALKQSLRERGIDVRSFDGQLLHEPSTVLTGSGAGYRVFTPFWKALASGPEPRDPIDAPKSMKGPSRKISSLSIDDLLPLPASPDWAGGLRDRWTPGEAGAHERLAAFIEEGLEGYADGRDFPARPVTSHLSPHLAHGEITPHTIFAVLRERAARLTGSDTAKFRQEIGWREFCHHLLFHYPKIAADNFQPGFDDFPWASDSKGLRAWQRGQTGYPIVDAGMRELWQTGIMHNRVRMITASFLTKHLLVDWREGERWFWDTLVDADPASNPANWQWVAGSGADAAPYFRIFNPVLQGEKFDPEGAYVRRFVPEIAALPDKYLHRPWEAQARTLTQAGVALGRTYPHPIVDHKKARERALAAYAATKAPA